MNKAVFLDRDGTICRDPGHLIQPGAFELLEGALEGLRMLQQDGFSLFIVTNQSGVARGYFTPGQVEALNRHIEGALAKKGVRIAETVYCPYLAGGRVVEFARDADCRKPKPGMLLYLARKYSLDLGCSYMVGDKWSDAAAGWAAGTQPALVGPGGKNYLPGPAREILRFANLAEFAAHVRPVHRAPSRE